MLNTFSIFGAAMISANWPESFWKCRNKAQIHASTYNMGRRFREVQCSQWNQSFYLSRPIQWFQMRMSTNSIRIGHNKLQFAISWNPTSKTWFRSLQCLFAVKKLTLTTSDPWGIYKKQNWRRVWTGFGGSIVYSVILNTSIPFTWNDSEPFLCRCRWL